MGYFTVELDTTAPVVTWGPPSNTDAGDTLSVPFILNEPALLSAELSLVDGRSLPMTVGAGVLTVVLPDDTPDGLAVLSAFVRDEVLNSATRALEIPVTGVAPVRIESSGGMPVGPPTEHHRPGRTAPTPTPDRTLVRFASGTQAGSRSRVAVRASGHVRVVASSDGHVAATAPYSIEATVVSQGQVHARVRGNSGASASAGAVVSRREGPENEIAAATLLDLL